MTPERLPAASAASLSRRRNSASPYRAKISGIGIPAASVTSLSVSITSRPLLSARSPATVVFPHPGIPTRTMFSFSVRIER
jgi:hypothetical protein